MKVLIAVDIEGIAGIANAREYEHFEFGREWCTMDTNAAVEGALGGGAKEIVVSTMGVLYAAEDNDENALGQALTATGMTPLAAMAMMVFVLLYIPCLATVAAVRREAGTGECSRTAAGGTC